MTKKLDSVFRRFKKKECKSKKQFNTLESAICALKSIQKKKKIMLNHRVYICPACRAYHIGLRHSKLQRMTELFEKIKLEGTTNE